MAALDDSYDVHDKCVAMGLDPDRVSHLARARAEMYREANERYEREHPMTPERAKREEKARKQRSVLLQLMLERYGPYAPKDEP